VLRSQSLIPLTGGAYQSRNAIGDYEIAENVFMEINPQETDAPAPATHFQREGLRALSAPPVQGPGRGVFTLSTGACVAAVGNAFYSIGTDFQFTLLGNLGQQSNPIGVSDNGNNGVVVDNSNIGYQFTLAGMTGFAPISDPTGTFVGATNVDFSDTYLAFNVPGTNGWIVTDPDTLTFNALQAANKDSKPDPILTLKFNLRQAWLLGSESTEVWYLAGSTPFPYQSWPNTLVPYGCAAKYSVVQADVDLFWIARNMQGQAIAVQTKGNSVIAISTRALEYEWSTYSTVADCVGGTYQIAGHTFVIFHFPTADKSWGYDLSTKQWHRRTYIDANGVAHREKVSFYASVGPDGGYPKTIIGQDWSTGQLYAVDPQTYNDNGQPIVCRRSFPHQMSDMREVTHIAFVADFATGEATGLTEGNVALANGLTLTSPALCMRYSKDGGHTWSNYRQKALTTSGHYRSMMRFRGLGQGRDWVFELLWVYPGQTALNGAYAEPMVHGA
jgi:hypothetical protein